MGKWGVAMVRPAVAIIFVVAFLVGALTAMRPDPRKRRKIMGWLAAGLRNRAVQIILAALVGAVLAFLVVWFAAPRIEQGLLDDQPLNPEERASYALGVPSLYATRLIGVIAGSAALIAAIGSLLRAYAHGEPNRQEFDLAGKLTAVTAGMLAVTAAMLSMIEDGFQIVG